MKRNKRYKVLYSDANNFNKGNYTISNSFENIIQAILYMKKNYKECDFKMWGGMSVFDSKDKLLYKLYKFEV